MDLGEAGCRALLCKLYDEAAEPESGSDHT
jgi:hypothetical protein